MGQRLLQVATTELPAISDEMAKRLKVAKDCKGRGCSGTLAHDRRLPNCQSRHGGVYQNRGPLKWTPNSKVPL